MTLRELVWMCDERKRVLGELAAWQVAMLCGYMPFVNAKLNPASINPYRGTSRATSAKVQAVKDFIASRGIAALGGYGANDQ